MSRTRRSEGPLYRQARWRAEDRAEQGLPTVDSTPDARWRDVPVVGSVVACLVSLLMMLVWLLRDGWSMELTWGLLLLPLLAGTWSRRSPPGSRC